MASYQEIAPNKFKIYVDVETEEGQKRKRRTKTIVAKSDRALKKAITEFEIEVSKQSENLSKIKFEQFADRWMNVYVRPKLTVKTRNTYKTCLDNGPIDYFGDMQLAKIKTYHVEKFFAEQKKINAGSLKGKYLCLCSIFTKAVKWGVIENSPMKNVDEPQERSKRERPFKAYTEVQLKKVLAVLDRDAFKKLRIQSKLACFVGLRLAEIAGLRKDCFDFVHNKIRIDRTLQYDKETKKFFLGPVKNKMPRIVNVPQKFMQGELKEYVYWHNWLQKKCGEAWKPLIINKQPIDLLFTNEIGYPNHINSMGNEWIKFLKKHPNLPYLNFHGLRHTCASLLVLKGVNFKIIQEQLGHKNIRETIETYSHLEESSKAEALDKLDEVL
ncbi:tyrosine-type recombinase/integrase [Sporolactobacillus kofuensis]|uniref:Tyrosine-type recombinase/integrase n=1 Tax=Sporolactobacillus kofuensis TaxID=269672 RepID=A0ABW1WDB4_9BACL|nr:site-specific integrase [Sporolactobacillus kofuensis]MCO7175526.1 site-specific integrase [Sporolactobacillus kofuensis]